MSKLDELLKEGVLSQEEFDKEKAKVLGTNKSSVEKEKQEISKTSNKNHQDSQVKEVLINEPKNLYNQYRGKFSPLSIFIVVVLFFTIISFISWDQDRNNSSQSVVQEQPQATSQTSRCIAVNDSDLITSLYFGDGFEVQNVYAVKSNDFKLAHYISAEIINSRNLGIDGEVITWLAAGELDDISYLEGVGGFGEVYSSWGSANQNKQGSAYDDGYSESRDCVK
jgi:hypothetical protein